MLDIIKINYEQERPTVLARDLHKFLEVNSKYNDWFNRMKSYGFSENTDFAAITRKKVTAQGNESVYQDHQLTIDMAKEISMLQRNEKGKQARQYFIELEKAWNSPEQVMARALKLADKKIQSLTTEVKDMKPKALFADSVAASKTSILVGDLAKILKQNGVDTGAVRLFRWLRENGYLIRRKGTDYNMPTQKSMELGLFEIKETAIAHSDGHTTISKTPKVSGKGQQYIINVFLS